MRVRNGLNASPARRNHSAIIRNSRRPARVSSASQSRLLSRQMWYAAHKCATGLYIGQMRLSRWVDAGAQSGRHAGLGDHVKGTRPAGTVARLLVLAAGDNREEDDAGQAAAERGIVIAGAYVGRRVRRAGEPQGQLGSYREAVAEALVHALQSVEKVAGRIRVLPQRAGSRSG